MIRLLVGHELAVYSQHLPLDGHPVLGNAAQLGHALGFRQLRPFFARQDAWLGVQTELPRPLSLGKLVERVGRVLGNPPKILPGGPAPDSGRTEILQHGLRAGFRGEYRGSVVVLGDVNPGAELIAAGDVIVMGALRGVVHAGAGGRESAIVYARPIASAQIRIAGAVARSADDNSLGAMRRSQERPEAELARLQDGVIQIESYQPQRS